MHLDPCSKISFLPSSIISLSPPFPSQRSINRKSGTRSYRHTARIRPYFSSVYRINVCMYVWIAGTSRACTTRRRRSITFWTRRVRSGSRSSATRWERRSAWCCSRWGRNTMPRSARCSPSRPSPSLHTCCPAPSARLLCAMASSSRWAILSIFFPFSRILGCG